LRFHGGTLANFVALAHGGCDKPRVPPGGDDRKFHLEIFTYFPLGEPPKIGNVLT
jgi:hypothetical protein